MTHAARQPIAVVGVSALFPGSVDNTGFWSDILAGTDRITDVPASHWLIEDYYDADLTAPDRTYGRRGGFLEAVDLDVMGFGIPPAVLPSTDTAQLLALIVAQRVLDDAIGSQFTELDRTRASVILGVTSGQELFGAMASRMSRPLWLQGMRRAGIAEDRALAACERIASLHPEWTESTFPGLLGNVVAGRIANRLDLGGTNCVTDAACASSFSALSMGVNELYLGDSDLVIAGGVDTMNDIFMYMCFSKTPALSATEDIRPFSDRADGTMLGEGIGMVAIKRLADAERDGNQIYCVINGVGASSDGRSKSVYAPVSSGQARALDNAYAKAGYTPDTVELIEAHGTGTVAGDAAEFGGLEIAFQSGGRTDRQWCALGSVKSQIGHTKAAAGAAGLIKAIMGLHHRVLPPTAKIDAPNPQLDLENSPFYLNTTPRPWVRNSTHERRASVSSFGFGGSNFHVALSEYTGSAPRAARTRTFDAELVVLCGENSADIIAQAQRHIRAATVEGYLQFLAHSSQKGYEAGAPVRLSLVATTERDLGTRLAQATERIGGDPNEAFSTPDGIHYGTGPLHGDVAFLFPGQGSQYLGMGGALAQHYPVTLAPWDRAADLPWDGTSLEEVVFPRTSFAPDALRTQQATLTATEWAQPAIGAASLGFLALLRQVGVVAAHAGGHSFGEITALHAAGVLSQADMLRVARRRGQLMAEAAQIPGAMTAVALPIEKVRELLHPFGGDVVIANHNSQTQVVLSGATDAIEQVEVHFKNNGTTAKRLPVATAFHSPVVSDASGAFIDFLETIAFNAPTIPVYANQTAAPYPHEPPSMRSQLGQQLASPVRFVEMIEGMHDAGARVFVEAGPSSILTGLVRKILRGRDHCAVTLDSKKKPGVQPFFAGLGQLAAAGVEMDLGRLWDDYAPAHNPHDIVNPKLTIAINGANHEKPYPPPDLSDLVGPNDRITSTPPPTPQPERTPTPAMSLSTPTDPSVSSNGHESAPSTPLAASPPPAGILETFAALQNQTAQTHADYVKVMADAHRAFLEVAEQSLKVFGQLTSGGTSATPTQALPVAAAPVSPPPPVAPSPVIATPAPQPAPAVSAPVVSAPVVSAPVPQPSPVAVPVTEPASVLPAEASGTDEGLTAVLLGVVSDKTGYPTDMLAMEMELEADLGIDSIKRVEILSGMEDAVPGLPEVDLQVMADLVTLGQIVDYMASQVQPSGGPAGNFKSPAGPTLSRFALQTVLAPATGESMAGLTSGPIAVTSDGGNVSHHLVAALRAAGVDAEHTDHVTASHTGAILLAGLREATTIDEAIATNRAGFATARALAGTTGAKLFVTVTGLGGTFGTDGAAGAATWTSGLSALAKTAAIEWPGATVKAIDVDTRNRDAGEVASLLAAELLGGGPQVDVGLGTNRRLSLTSTAVPVQTGPMPLGPTDVIVVSGGARGVTAATMIELARESRATFVLLGRSALETEPLLCHQATSDAELKSALLTRARNSGVTPTPIELSRQVSIVQSNREIRATLDSIHAAGGHATYETIDVTNSRALGHLFAVIRQTVGPITGLVHGAGVLADRLLLDKTDDQFDRVFNTKVDGLRALLGASEGDALKLLLLFSSVAARTGNRGQADYAMANEILNKVAVAESVRRGRNCVVKALGWGPWEGGMVTPGLRKHFEAMGVDLIPINTGARMLVDEVCSPQTDQVEVVLGGGVLGGISLAAVS